MAKKPKLRIFAGPNGSGKSTLYHNIKDFFSTRIFINADQLEQGFNANNYINFQEIGIHVDDQSFQKFCNQHGQYMKAGFNELTWNLTVRENVLVVTDVTYKIFNSMHFAIVADFIRHELIKLKASFAFETVFSHPSKLDLIDFAHENGYKVYLYFVGTDSPEVNEQRVIDRVNKGGHNVRSEDIYKRYSRTMDLLLDMIKKCDLTYLWDNSQQKYLYVGENNNGYLNIELEYPPNWIVNHVLNKLDPQSTDEI